MERELLNSSVERNVDRLLRGSNIHIPKYFSILSIEVPKSRLAEDTLLFAKNELDEAMFNHSNRVFLMGSVLAHDQFPEWKIDMEKYFLTSILHDIGVAQKYHLTTSMSFEFKGGLVSHNFITSKGGSNEIADDVSEAIIRHTDSNVDGKITPLGQLIQLSTTLDVLGGYPDLYNAKTIAEIVNEWPRKDFNNHFAKLMELEMKHKPGCHTTSKQCNNYIDRIRNSVI